MPTRHTPSYRKSIPPIDLPTLLSEDHGPIAAVLTEFVSKFPFLHIEFADVGEISKPYEITSQPEADKCLLLLANYVDKYNYVDNIKGFNVRFSKVYEREDLIRSIENSLKLPDITPEYWPGKWKSKEDLDIFFERVWSKYLPFGLKMSYLKSRDPSLYNGIRNFSEAYGRPWPERFAMPNERDRLADTFKKFQTQGAKALTPKELLAVARKLNRDQLKPNSSS